MILAVASTIALYSASVLEWDIIFCFLAYQEMRLGPKNTAKPPVDFQSSVHPAQSASENALTIVEAECRV
jgi:hypothetical protein